MSGFKANLTDLTARVNDRLVRDGRIPYHKSTISSARAGKGHPALVEVVRLVEAEMLQEAAAAAKVAPRLCECGEPLEKDQAVCLDCQMDDIEGLDLEDQFDRLMGGEA